MSDLPSLPVDTITGMDILKMLNAPTKYYEFKEFAESGKLCSPKYNPAFRGQGKDDEWGNPIKGRQESHPRLQIGNYFLLIKSSKVASPTQPERNARLWICQVYETSKRIGDVYKIKIGRKKIRYKYVNIGYLDWSHPSNFAIFKQKVFDITRSLHQNNGGNWNDSILHFHIFKDGMDLDFINWPLEKPQGLI
jgi:hypothetical protein